MTRSWFCRLPRAALMVAVALAISPGPAIAHDPSAWGGLFRTRDGGASWLALNSGSFVSGAIALAISPTAPHDLLLATESGVLASKNGGRDWTVEATQVLVGPAFAVAYNADGRRALASGASNIFRRDGDGWRAIAAPSGAAPARTLARGSTPGRVYLAGWSGVHVSENWGASWIDASGGLPAGPVDAVVVDHGDPEVVYAVAAAQLWRSDERGHQWRPCPLAAASGRVEAVTLDRSAPGRLWALVSGQLFLSDDRGERWVPAGRALPEPKPAARGLSVTGRVILVATDRGLYRSPNAGGQWEALTENLPGHLEAGFLVGDPSSASTIYAGFALTPYVEQWRRAADGRSLLSRLSTADLAGGVAFLALLVVTSAAAVRQLWRSHPRAQLGAREAPREAGASGGGNA